MLLFQDLPLPVQIAFVQHMTNFTCSVLVTAAVSATTGKDATTASAAAAAAAIPNDDDRLLPLCLEELHAGGELFYVSDPTAIPSLCETTWETMISTQLLEVLENNSTNNNATVAEDTVWTPPMAAAPGGPSQQQQQTRSHLTAVLGLGIGMTVVFLLAIVVKLKTTTRHYKSNRTNDKSPPSPTEGLGVDVINIRGDESFSSENSEPAAAAPSEETPDTASPHGTGGNSCTHGAPLPTTTTSDFSISSSSFGPNPYRPENQFLSDRSNELLRNPSSLSSIKHHCGMLQRFPNPPPLVVTERLSDDNPVHQRKRFPRSNSSSSRVFTFEERDIAKKRPSVVEILRVPSADDSRMNFQQDGTLQSVSLLDKENDENVKPVPQRNRSIFQLDTKTTLFEETISNNAGEPLQGSGGGSRV